MSRDQEAATVDRIKDQILGDLAATVHGFYHAMPPYYFHVTSEDITALAKPVLRHRVVCSFAAQANNLTSDIIIDRLVEHFARAGKALAAAHAAGKA